MAGFTVPGYKYPPYTNPPRAPAGAPGTTGQTPYAGVGTPGSSPYVPEEAEAQRQRETTRLGQQTGIEGQSRLGQEAAGYGTAATEQQAKLQAEAEARRFNQFSPYFQSLFGGAGGQGGVTTPPREQYGGGAADAARAAAFARAKDMAAKIAQSGVTGLRNAMASRGIGGSGIEVGGTGEILGNATNQLGNVSQEQLIQDLEQQRHESDISYQGNITQRGQDIQAEQARRAALMGLFNQQFGGDITARY